MVSFPLGRAIYQLVNRTNEILVTIARIYKAFKPQMSRVLTINPVAKLFAGFEMGDVLARQLDGIPRFRVAAYSGGAVMERKAAKAPDLYPATRGKHMGHGVDHGLDRQLHVP